MSLSSSQDLPCAKKIVVEPPADVGGKLKDAAAYIDRRVSLQAQDGRALSEALRDDDDCDSVETHLDEEDDIQLGAEGGFSQQIANERKKSVVKCCCDCGPNSHCKSNKCSCRKAGRKCLDCQPKLRSGSAECQCENVADDQIGTRELELKEEARNQSRSQGSSANLQFSQSSLPRHVGRARWPCWRR